MVMVRMLRNVVNSLILPTGLVGRRDTPESAASTPRRTTRESASSRSEIPRSHALLAAKGDLNQVFQSQDDSVAAALRRQEFAIHHNKRPPNKSWLFEHHSKKLVIRKRLAIDSQLSERGTDPRKELGGRPVSEYTAKLSLGKGVRKKVPQLKLDGLL